MEHRLSDLVRIDPPRRYQDWRKVTASPGSTLTEVLRSQVPDDSDVLVVAGDDPLLTAPAHEVGPGRTVAALRVGTGPLTYDRLRVLLRSLEASDPVVIRRTAEKLADALAGAAGLVLTDPLTRSLATVTGAGLGPVGPAAGSFRPGVVQAAPAGRRRSADAVVDGRVAVKGRPVVFGRGPVPGPRQEWYERLSALSHYPLVLTVEDGTVTGMKASESGSALAAGALSGLFAADPGHARVTALEFGLNPTAPRLPFSTESNIAAAGGGTASVHLVLGSELTEYQLVLGCATSTLTAVGSPVPLAGAGTAPAPPADAPAPAHRPSVRAGQGALRLMTADGLWDSFPVGT
ncbi:hypothetical protein H9Y04_28515 [Streptomyces sp. TRM66268-LWL]|uniref:Uncharacterized protein n=1 Tax=Streptomyces polyasparticus TaxID=2767826 RepID=A0ABR7SM23_9ACTN|nr:hypothetical protein [Streptomyces polyasparticus]MBC9716482.1 hypothetical protein [Streptomyces polyasparticus]